MLKKEPCSREKISCQSQESTLRGMRKLRLFMGVSFEAKTSWQNMIEENRSFGSEKTWNR